MKSTESRGFYLPNFQDIIRLKSWNSWTFPNFRTISVYIDVNLYAFGTLGVKMSCYNIQPAKTLDIHFYDFEWLNQNEKVSVMSHNQY